MNDSAGQLVSIGEATVFVRRLFVSPDPKPELPVLVFLHDSLGCVDTWRDFPRSLAERLNLDAIVYDRQGYGGSSPLGSATRTPRYLEEQADVLLALLDDMATHQAVLFGHSDGGSIALIAAGVAPERFSAVVTEGAHVFVEDRTLAGIFAAREVFATTNLAERLARYHGHKVAGLVGAWIDTWLSPEFRSWNIERYLPRIACPVLAIQGEADEYGTSAQVEAIVRGVGARADSLLIPGIGHTPHREARETVLATAARFIADALRDR